ncbi:hypothetical protein B9Z55_015587 [Caenorhabditis nigoni]|uniref:Uncharacterized protein n=1 Tax=Caenorhabditis nigoni TaxID=1611254 RepID=A0A2G5UBN5_9PELO|nr:hypothetical protein B9Z55_015587 [Caenorhabditis nigoni]
MPIHSDVPLDLMDPIDGTPTPAPALATPKVYPLRMSRSCGIQTTLVIKGELIYEAGFMDVGQHAAQVFENISESSILERITKWVYEVTIEKIVGVGFISIFVVIVVKCCLFGTSVYVNPMETQSNESQSNEAALACRWECHELARCS